MMNNQSNVNISSLYSSSLMMIPSSTDILSNYNMIGGGSIDDDPDLQLIPSSSSSVIFNTTINYLMRTNGNEFETQIDNFTNGSGEHGIDGFMDGADKVSREYIFDRTDVRVIFITLYSIVFCCCFFGKIYYCHQLLHFIVMCERRKKNLNKIVVRA